MCDRILVVVISIMLLGLGCASQLPAAKSRDLTPHQNGESQITFGSGRNSGLRPVVKSIDFVGNSKFKDTTLQKKLGFKIGDYLDPILAGAYRGTLTEFYRKEGFAFVQVTLDKEKLQQGDVVYTIDEGPRVKVAKVTFSGNKAIKTSALKKAIKSETKKRFFWPRYYIEEKVAEDVQRLQNIYYEKGFLDYNIKPRLEFTEGKSKIQITFEIVEGPIYSVGKIIFAGNEHFDEKMLLAGLKLKQGQAYNRRLADSHTKLLAKLYHEQGFIDAKVEQRPGFIGEVNVVNVVFNITEGRQFRIGRIDITGNEQTQDKVIRRVLDEYDFSPGQLYNADIAPKQGGGKLERDVQRMTLAEEVIIRPVAPVTGAPDQKDVKVDIKEGRTGMIMIGGGVSSDAAIMGQLVYHQRNFDITDWPESLEEFITGKAFKGAGQSLRIAAEPGTEVSQYYIEFSEPYFRDKPVSLDVVGSSWSRFRESYDEQRIKGFVGFEKRLKNEWRRSIGIRCENVDVGNLDTDAPQEIIDVKGGNGLVGVKLGIGRDLRDDKWYPSTGRWFNASYEQVAGDEVFGVLSGTYRWYKTLYEDLAERKTILTMKLLGGVVLGDAQPFEKFYAGGSGTYGIRGFDYRGVSTRGLQTNVPAGTAERKDPIGSDWIFLANTEVIVPLAGDNFAALFFLDSGVIDTGGYRASVGMGVQILIPQWFGPVPMRFELAAPFMKDGEDETRTFSFSIGRLF